MNDTTSAMDREVAVELREAIDTIEEAYEFMLAYAAQGRAQEDQVEGSSQIRSYLDRFRSALDVLARRIPVLTPVDGSGKAFGEHLGRDIDVMKSILDLLTSGKSISSDMIDNTNGLIAVRSLLTDLFFVDQVLLPKRG